MHSVTRAQIYKNVAVIAMNYYDNVISLFITPNAAKSHVNLAVFNVINNNNNDDNTMVIISPIIELVVNH